MMDIAGSDVSCAAYSPDADDRRIPLTAEQKHLLTGVDLRIFIC